MIDIEQQKKYDYLTSKFLYLGLVCSKDLVNGVPDLVIPLSSVEFILGDALLPPICPSRTDVTPYTEKDNVVSVEDFVKCLSRNHDNRIYTFYAVDMKKFYSSCDTRNSAIDSELVKLKYLCVPDFTALVTFIEKACPRVRPSFENMLSRETCVFELLELRKAFTWRPF